MAAAGLPRACLPPPFYFKRKMDKEKFYEVDGGIVVEGMQAADAPADGGTEPRAGTAVGKKLRVCASKTRSQALSLTGANAEVLYFPTDADCIVFGGKVYWSGSELRIKNMNASGGSTFGIITRTSEMQGVYFDSDVQASTAGLFPHGSNANGVLTLHTNAGNYYHQLGFSSDGNIYHRAFHGKVPDSTTAWKKVSLVSAKSGTPAALEESGVAELMAEVEALRGEVAELKKAVY